MSQLTQKDITEILAKKGEKRYSYFVRTVVQTEEVWGLADDEGWVMLEEDDGSGDVIPFFPNPEFAEIFREAAGLQDNQVEPLDLAEFIEWLEDFTEDNIKVGVFLNAEMQGAVMEATRLRDDIQKEMDKEVGE